MGVYKKEQGKKEKKEENRQKKEERNRQPAQRYKPSGERAIAIVPREDETTALTGKEGDRH